MTIRHAVPEEAAELTALAIRSKASWGYDEAFMRQVSSELRITEEDIGARPVYVWVDEGRHLGFYALLPDPPEVELDLFFIDPDAQRRGVGRRLLHHAIVECVRHGWRVMTIVSDPFAEQFYLSCGAVRVGESRSPSTGRSLPLLHLDIPFAPDDHMLQTYLDEISQFRQPDESEIAALLGQIKQGVDDAKRRLIEGHLLLVVEVARRSEHPRDIRLIDLIQEGNIGLMRAIDTYVPAKGSFRAFARVSIREAIQRAITRFRGHDV